MCDVAYPCTRWTKRSFLGACKGFICTYYVPSSRAFWSYLNEDWTWNAHTYNFTNSSHWHKGKTAYTERTGKQMTFIIQNLFLTLLSSLKQLHLLPDFCIKVKCKEGDITSCLLHFQLFILIWKYDQRIPLCLTSKQWHFNPVIICIPKGLISVSI